MKSTIKLFIKITLSELNFSIYRVIKTKKNVCTLETTKKLFSYKLG